MSRAHSAPAPELARQSGSLTGTATLLRFMLRRDRIRFPAWVLGIAALMAYFSNAIGAVLDEAGLESMAVFALNPAVALVGGPGYGFDDLTVPRFLAGMYALYIMLGMALLSITTMARHTRAEEQSGRSELVRANVVGRHAQLTAALLLTIAMNIAASVLIGVVVIASMIEPRPAFGGAVLLGFSAGAVGLCFAAVAAIAAQVSPYSRVSSSVAGGVLAVAFVVRGLGDLSATQDGRFKWLSWLSPLGWSQQTAPFTLDRWWPLAISVGFTIVAVTIAYRLQARRDHAAGLFADRLGSPMAAQWLNGPLSLAFRLQRGAIIGWALSLFLAGIAFGAFTQPMAHGAADLPAEVLKVMHGATGIVNGYLGYLGSMFAIMVAVFVILAVQSLRGEEIAGRAEAIAATATHRSRWLLAWLFVTAISAVGLLLAAGIGTAIGAAASTGDWSLVTSTVAGHLAHAPEPWFFLALTAVLYGWLPRATAAVWLLFAYGTVLAFFGQMLDLSQATLNTSVFLHIGQYPAEALSWSAIGVLTVLTAAIIAASATGFVRRDMQIR